MENAVSQKFCDERNMNTVKRLDKHSEEIDDLKAAVIKLTQIVEQMNKESELKKIQPSDIKPNLSFWQTDSGKVIVRTLCIIGVALTFAAIGFNYFKEYISVIAK